MNFISENCEAFVHATDAFQSQYPMAVKAWSCLEDLRSKFGQAGVSMVSASKYFDDQMDFGSKTELQALFCQAFACVSEKVDKYMCTSGQPGIDFIQQLQLFHPKKLILLDTTDFTALPGLQEVPDSELQRYVETLGPKAVKASAGLPIDLTLFWNSCMEAVPTLAACAKKYIYSCVSSADAERNFSLYNLVFSERRRPLGEETLKALLFLYYNNFVSYEVCAS